MAPKDQDIGCQVAKIVAKGNLETVTVEPCSTVFQKLIKNTNKSHTTGWHIPSVRITWAVVMLKEFCDFSFKAISYQALSFVWKIGMAIYENSFCGFL